MSCMKGIAHGKMIELEGELGFPDGQPVVVVVHRMLPPGEGIRASAGAWADVGEEFDAWLESMRRSREEDRRELGP
jgi:hypothetical protein